MSQPPAWCREYIGLPFGEKGRGPGSWDCWGLVRQVRADLCGDTDLPDYVSAYTSTLDRDSVAAAVTAGLTQGWRQISTPKPMSLVILRLAGRPWHCGIMVNSEWMLHTTAQTNSVLERVDSLQWRNRIEGYYDRA